jgi:sulfur relay (sulfurtransferase) DsrF/TusC family protein
MLELIIIAFIFWMGFQAGVMYLSWKLRDIIRTEARKEGIIVDDEYNVVEKTEKTNVQSLWVEKVHDIMYLYDTEDTFICQAKSLEELATLALKYKNIKYASVMNGNDIFAFINGKVKTAQEVLR